MTPDGGQLRVHPDEIWALLGIDLARRDPRDQQRLANIMHRFGYTSKPYWIGSGADRKKVRGYVKNVGLDYQGDGGNEG